VTRDDLCGRRDASPRARDDALTVLSRALLVSTIVAVLMLVR
jgi:hypothetical protein